jgi:FAD/FMN-containing dehydrogenase
MKNVVSFLIWIASSFLFAQEDSVCIENRSGLNTIWVKEIVRAESVNQLSEAIAKHRGTITIGGARNAMGGQSALENSLHIDMRPFNRIIEFDKEKKQIRVESGITWYEIQKFIDSFNLSIDIMQTYANFSIGGSVSTNVHGRYLGKGPLISSIESLQLVLADGSVVETNREANSDLFYSTIGGYGLLGVITAVTLNLTDNCKISREEKKMRTSNYYDFFMDKILKDSLIIFHNADIYPNSYRSIRSVSFRMTDEALTITNRLRPQKDNYRFNQIAFKYISSWPTGKWTRQHLVDPILYAKKIVCWRNYEASYDIQELEPKNKGKATYVLQEYFVPVSEFYSFSNQMFSILKEQKVNVINISIRFTKADTLSMLSWAKSDVFSFVIYYKLKTDEKSLEKEIEWTQMLLNEVIKIKGTYYLPYRLLANKDQFQAAYPSFVDFLQVKLKYDPECKFKNQLYTRYFMN